MWCDTLSSRQERRLTARCCAHLCRLRASIVRVIVDGVLGVTVDVHIGHDEVLVIYVAIFVVIFCNWRCTLYNLEIPSLSVQPKRSTLRTPVRFSNCGATSALLR